MSADTIQPNLNQAAGVLPSIDPAGSLDIDAQQVDHLLIVKAFADDLDLVETVKRLVPTQMGVKPGIMVLGLVLDTLTGRSPLYRLVDFYEGRDTELLLGERVPASAFLVSPANLKQLGQGQPFITRLPATYAECGRVISEAVGSNQWEELGQISQTKATANRPADLYRAAEATVTLYGQPYRAVVVHSSAHDKRRQKKIERELAKESASLQKSFQEQCLPEYACAADAWASQTSRYHELSYQIEPC